MASGRDLGKYITERIVAYLETPKEQRAQNKVNREAWSSRWFGMMPLSVHLWLSGQRNKRRFRRRDPEQSTPPHDKGHYS